MTDSEERKVVEFERLNLLGKAVFLTGTAIRTSVSLIDKALDRAVDIVIESEKAFKQGRDPNVEDAKILGEWEGESGREPGRRKASD